MLIMTSSSTFLTGEDEEEQEQRRLQSPEEDATPSHSHKRRWSTPFDSGDGGFTVSDDENRGVSGLNLEEFFSCSPDNSYSFYLGGKISPWGSSGPPLLRSNAASRGEQRRGRNATVTKRDIPPFLTTLDCNGRPRFHHRRVRSEGRLEIASVAVDSPEIVSVRGREGLRIGTVRISQQDEEQQNH